jgi:hypothetical protein
MPHFPIVAFWEQDQGTEEEASLRECRMIRAAARAGLTAVAMIGFAGVAPAADLDYSSKGGNLEPYAPYYYHRDQPRQGLGQGQYHEEKYEERRYSEPAPPVERYSHRDAPPPDRYTRYDAPRDSRYDQRGCLSKGEIRYRLKEHGWQEFQDLDFRGETAIVTARRPDGMLYKLEVDRCSGVIVQARLLEEGRGWRQGSRGPGYTY